MWLDVEMDKIFQIKVVTQKTMIDKFWIITELRWDVYKFNYTTFPEWNMKYFSVWSNKILLIMGYKFFKGYLHNESQLQNGQNIHSTESYFSSTY